MASVNDVSSRMCVLIGLVDLFGRFSPKDEMLFLVSMTRFAGFVGQRPIFMTYMSREVLTSAFSVVVPRCFPCSVFLPLSAN